ncbi:hypothetical protein DPMN_049269 [Dreissena polymorpha]|uniref:Uncharacterized protein n=1 Tax=Dreissena polymorpha TaxID=45954 RepID=A0A9D4CF23_DREPO|nr:hypothetical protein DPMN_049269 [Dreissena polymorpha]
MADLGSDIKDINGSLKLAKKEVPLSLTGIKFNFEFTFQTQAEMGLRYLVGRLSTDLTRPAASPSAKWITRITSSAQSVPRRM